MSADNGYVIRKNKDNRFVLQMYFASFDDYPDVEDPSAPVFDTLEEAVMKFAEWETDPWFICEYGLSVKVLPQKTWAEAQADAQSQANSQAGTEA